MHLKLTQKTLNSAIYSFHIQEKKQLSFFHFFCIAHMLSSTNKTEQNKSKKENRNILYVVYFFFFTVC